MKTRAWVLTGFVILVSAFVLFAPFLVNRYLLRFITTVAMFAALSLSWNILGGYTGYFSFGHAVFFGLGAYITAIMMVKLGSSFLLTLIPAGVGAVAFALLVGFPVLRLRGHYFALATLGVCEAVRGIVNNLEGITGGGGGLSLPIFVGGIGSIYRYFYFLMIVVLAIVTFVSYLISRSRFGYGLIAIREDEESARVAGVHTTKYKMIAFAISAFFPGILGGIYAYWMTFVEPSDVFGIRNSLLVLIMVLLGGIGTIAGPIIGAVSFSIISEVFWNQLLQYHLTILGVTMIIIVILLPKGFMDVTQGLRRFSISSVLGNLKKYSE